MLELIQQPWHWSVAGVLVGLTVPILLILGNKKFGISSSLRHICAACVPANIPFFQYDWKKESWNLFFVVGIFLGGVIATQFLSNGEPIDIAPATQEVLAGWGITDTTALLPSQIFSVENILSLKGLIFFVIGGFLVGFGTRYAGGCTSGHAIMGLSNLQLPSLIATISFMVGGFISSNLILPLVFNWLK
jgi:uncharacterized membrane protein YedE/YeeE